MVVVLVYPYAVLMYLKVYGLLLTSTIATEDLVFQLLTYHIMTLHTLLAENYRLHFIIATQCFYQMLITMGCSY
jgi:hypothetical protein